MWYNYWNNRRLKINNMKLFTLMFCLFAIVAMSQNEISMNTGNGQGNLTNVANNNNGNIQNRNIQIPINNSEGNNPVANQSAVNINQVQSNAGINIQQEGNYNHQIQTQQREPVVVSNNHSSGSSSSSFSTGSRQKTSMFKTISKKVQVFQYKHKGKKKFHHNRSKPSRSSVLRCF